MTAETVEVKTEEVTNRVETVVIEENIGSKGYAFVLQGDQPLEMLKDIVMRGREAGEKHIAETAKRYQLVSIPSHINRNDFMDNFLEYQAEEDVLYIAILELRNRNDWKYERFVESTKVDNRVHKGAREWKKYYVIYRIIDGEKVEVNALEKKGDAIDFARRFAEVQKIEEQLFIEYENRLVNSDPVVAVISPKFATTRHIVEVPANRYLYFGLNKEEESE